MTNPFQQPIGADPPLPTQAVQPQLEYVSGGTGLWSKTQSRSLPWAFDDISADFGDDIYLRMMLDPAVSAAINTLRTGIIEDGLTLIPAVTDPDDPATEKAQEIADFCDRALAGMETPIDDVLWDLLDALALGARVAEQVYKIDGDQLTLRALKVKPRRSTAFVVDAYMNVVGLLSLLPGMGYGVQVGTTIVGDPAKNPTLLPKSKFAIFTSRPISNDPRGSSLLRPAYGAWWMKQQVWPEYLKYLAVWATPITIGKTPQHAVETIDPATGTKIAATQAMLTTLLSLKNNSAAVFPFGSEIDLHEASGDGTVFGRAVDTLDRQITTAILYQTLATMEGAHQSRAASTTHKSTLDTIIRQAKRGLCGMLRTQVLRQLVAVNFGDDAARDLTPIPSLGSVEDPDITGRMTAVANLKRAGYLDESQLPGIDAQLGLPPRTPVESVDDEAGDQQGPPGAEPPAPEDDQEGPPDEQ